MLPVGFSSIAQNPTSVSSLSASATAIETGAVGHAVAGALRAVVIFDRRCDFGRFALGGGIVAAHQPLQFRKFADHFRDKVGLGKLAPRGLP